MTQPASTSTSTSTSTSDPLFVFITYGGSTARMAQWFFQSASNCLGRPLDTLILQAPYPPSARVEDVHVYASTTANPTPCHIPLRALFDSALFDSALFDSALFEHSLASRTFVLIYPSYGAKPPFVAREILASAKANSASSPSKLLGVVVCGNRTFGRGFCASAAKFRSVPVLSTVEISGSQDDANDIIRAAFDLI